MRPHWARVSPTLKTIAAIVEARVLAVPVRPVVAAVQAAQVVQGQTVALVVTPCRWWLLLRRQSMAPRARLSSASVALRRLPRPPQVKAKESNGATTCTS